jgi:hypothetical protein
MHLLLIRPTPPPPPLARAAPSTPDGRSVRASSAVRASSISSQVLGPPTPPSSSYVVAPPCPCCLGAGELDPTGEPRGCRGSSHSGGAWWSSG